MPSKLNRYYGRNDLHFITFSCYGRRPLLDCPLARDTFLKVLGIMRERYQFRLVGYVVMPDHVHLLISEPTSRNPSIVLKALKCRVAVELRGESGPLRLQDRTLRHFWEARFYDFNVYTTKKQKEKLKYMHENPLTRRLVKHPGDWAWSSYWFYETGKQRTIPIDPVD